MDFRSIGLRQKTIEIVDTRTVTADTAGENSIEMAYPRVNQPNEIISWATNVQNDEKECQAISYLYDK